MFSKANYARSVCLRCQFQLSRSTPSPLRRRRLPALRHGSRSFSDAGDGPATKQVDDPSNVISYASEYASDMKKPPPLNTVADADAEPELPLLPDEPKLRPRKRPPKEYRRTSGERVTFEAENISVDTLGKPARVIVMHDSKRPKRQIPIVADDQLAHSSDLAEKAASVLEEALRDAGEDDGSSSPTELLLEEALAHIDGLRPRDTTILPASEHAELAQTLLHGFTRRQLQKYAVQHLKETESRGVAREQPQLVESSAFSWLRTVKAWRPNKAASTQSKPQSAKHKLVETIMSEVWRLRIQEVVNCAGTALYSIVDRAVWHLLMANQVAWYPDVSQRLAPGESVKLTYGKKGGNPHRLLAIEASRATTHSVLDRVDAFVRLVDRAWIPSPRLPKMIGQHWLNRAQSMTKTQLEKKDGPGGEAGFEVVYVRDPYRQEHLESTPHAVERLLWSATSNTSTLMSTSHTVRFQSLASKIKNAYPARELWLGQTAQLSWTDQLSNWARLMVPLSRQPSSSPPDKLKSWGKSLPYSNEKKTIEENATLPDQAAPSFSASFWTVSATFGHTLFRYEKDLIMENTTRLREAKRSFASVMPGPSAFASLRQAETLPESSTTLILKFDARSSRGEPTLELHLRLRNPSHEGRLAWTDLDKELRVVQHTHVHDVLLPESPVDARLTQKLVASLSLPDDDPHTRCPQLYHFFSLSDLSPAQGRLLTPARLFYELPRHLRGALSPASGGTRTNLTSQAETETETETGPVSYDFAGLEVRRRVEIPLPGHHHRLCYDSVEAGLSGGRRAELTLCKVEPSQAQAQAQVPPIDDAAADAEQPKTNADKAAPSDEEYLDCVRDIALGTVFSWSPPHNDSPRTLPSVRY